MATATISACGSILLCLSSDCALNLASVISVPEENHGMESRGETPFCAKRDRAHKQALLRFGSYAKSDGVSLVAA